MMTGPQSKEPKPLPADDQNRLPAESPDVRGRSIEPKPRPDRGMPSHLPDSRPFEPIPDDPYGAVVAEESQRQRENDEPGRPSWFAQSGKVDIQNAGMRFAAGAILMLKGPYDIGRGGFGALGYDLVKPLIKGTQDHKKFQLPEYANSQGSTMSWWEHVESQFPEQNPVKKVAMGIVETAVAPAFLVGAVVEGATGGVKLAAQAVGKVVKRDHPKIEPSEEQAALAKQQESARKKHPAEEHKIWSDTKPPTLSS